MVKRYKLFVDSMADCYCEIDHHHDGSYVHLDDYAKLERKLAEARLLTTSEGTLVDEKLPLNTLAALKRSVAPAPTLIVRALDGFPRAVKPPLSAASSRT